MIYRYYIVLYSPKHGYVSNYSAAENGNEHLQFSDDVAQASFWDLEAKEESPSSLLDGKFKEVSWHSIRRTDDTVVDEDLEAEDAVLPPYCL